ncbi:hypothetical protein LPJ63_000627 [Coemansia sp. RSA 2711]|nr:hypothetical protein LPJ63_000627 [Coemansia sp. RSA 2711]
MRRSLCVAVQAAVLICGAGVAAGDCGFDEISVVTSPGFTITVDSEYKVLEDQTAGIKYGLYCDRQPTGVDGVDRWFKVPVSSAGIRVPVASGFLEALGRRDAIVAAEAPANLTNACLDTSKIRALGSDAEQTGVDVVFSSDAGSDGDRSVRLPADDTLAPLQLAEWIKLVAAFFNDEKRAAALFGGIADAYKCHRGNLQHVAARPHAYWVEYAGGDKASYSVVGSAYQKELLAAAGTTNATAAALNTTDVAAFQSAVSDAAVVFDQSQLTEHGQRATEWYRKFGYTDPQNSGSSFLRTRSIWRTDKYTSASGVSNFAEFAYVRPDLVLQDVVGVVQPTYDANYTRRWLLWLGGTNEDTVVVGADNYDCARPWLQQVAACTAREDFVGPADDSDSSSDDGSDDAGGSSGRAGRIAGGVVGAAAAVALGVVGLHYYNRHRRNARMQALRQTEFGGAEIGLARRTGSGFS